MKLHTNMKQPKWKWDILCFLRALKHFTYYTIINSWRRSPWAERWFIRYGTLFSIRLTVAAFYVHVPQNNEKQMRQLSVIPPMMYDSEQRRVKFINMNGLMDDPMKVYKARQFMNVWTEHEKEIFKEKWVVLVPMLADVWVTVCPQVSCWHVLSTLCHLRLTPIYF